LASPSARQDEGTWRTRTVVGLVVGILGFLVLVGTLFARSDALTKAVSGIGLVGALVFGIFAQVRYPRVSARHGATIAVILLIFDLVLAVTMGVVGYQRGHRPVDVTARVMLDGNEAVRTGQIAMLDVAVAERRPRLDVVFRVSDHNPQTSNCAPLTELRITPVQSGNSGVPITAEPGAHVLVPVLIDTRNLHLEIEVRNIHNDNGCAVDLAVTSARLTSE
jgi:hypothetical protein